MTLENRNRVYTFVALLVIIVIELVLVLVPALWSIRISLLWLVSWAIGLVVMLREERTNLGSVALLAGLGPIALLIHLFRKIKSGEWFCHDRHRNPNRRPDRGFL